MRHSVDETRGYNAEKNQVETDTEWPFLYVEYKAK